MRARTLRSILRAVCRREISAASRAATTSPINISSMSHSSELQQCESEASAWRFHQNRVVERFMNRATTASERALLKIATKRAVTEAGGPIECARMTRGGACYLSQYGNLDHLSFMPIDIAADIDKNHHILRALAEIAGFDLVERKPSDHAADVIGMSANAARECGEAIHAVLEAAKDGIITAAESRKVLDEIADAEQAFRHLKAEFLMTVGAGGKVA